MQAMTRETRNFCTYFDHRFLSRGLSLHHSLMEHCPSFHLWVLCLDETVHTELLGLSLPHVTLVPLSELEADDDELLKVKGGRTKVEYYFTCTPAWPLWLFNHAPHLDMITYLDADLFFFADPAPIFEELGERSVGIISHRFPPAMRWRECYGIYNVGWVSFRRDENGIACLRWWRERCLEWCHDRQETGRFGDQKYLDVWPELFDGVAVLKHPGANVAPWNLACHTLNWVDGRVMSCGLPLIFFHFHGLHRVWRWLVDPNVSIYGSRITPVFRRYVLMPYLVCLRTNATTAEDALPAGGRDKNAGRHLWLRWLKSAAAVLLGLLRGTITVWIGRSG